MRLIVPEERIEVLPPRSSEEECLDGLQDWPALEAQLLRIARNKSRDVLEQIKARNAPHETQDVLAVVTADTTIVAEDTDGRLVALGQPPDDESWPTIVKEWFQRFYAGRAHIAATALCVATPSGRSAERIAKSSVTFHSDVDRWLDWYIATGEPAGKAGGYAIQGAADIFVAGVQGSIGNVVGLPLRELLETFEELGIHAIDLK